MLLSGSSHSPYSVSSLWERHQSQFFQRLGAFSGFRLSELEVQELAGKPVAQTDNTSHGTAELLHRYLTMQRYTEWQLLSKKWTNHYPRDVYGSSTMGVKKVESCLHVPRLHLSQFDLDFFSSLLQSRAGGGSRPARTRSLTNEDVKRCLVLNTTNAAVSCGRRTCCSQVFSLDDRRRNKEKIDQTKNIIFCGQFHNLQHFTTF